MNLPAVELLKGPNINQLVDHVLEQLVDKDTAVPPKASGDDIATDSEEVGDRQEAAELLSKVDDMSDEQVDALLEKMEEEPRDRGG